MIKHKVKRRKKADRGPKRREGGNREYPRSSDTNRHTWQAMAFYWVDFHRAFWAP